MAFNIENTVELVSEKGFITLKEVREFVRNTETWSEETKVFLGTGKNWSRMITQYGDTTGNY